MAITLALVLQLMALAIICYFIGYEMGRRTRK